VASRLRDAEDYQDFLGLVREYLPDLEAQITGDGSPAGMIAAFAEAFGERYFPLVQGFEDGSIDDFSSLLQGIPVALYGWEYEDYHTLPQQGPGMILASLLVDFEGELGWEEGIGITAMEAAAEHIPQGLLRRVPAQGYPLEFLREALRDRYRGLLGFAEILCAQTGTVFLDTSFQEFYYPSGSGSWCEIPMWDREAVAELAEQWRAARGLQEEVMSFLDWLEADPAAHFAEVLDFLERRQRGKRRKGAEMGAP
jgi:hypothetical protein